MTPEDALAVLRTLEGNDDYEEAHLEADRILCEVLKGLQLIDLVDAWKRVGKWYA